MTDVTDDEPRIRLRPPTEEDAPVLAVLRTEAEAAPFNWFGPPREDATAGMSIDRVMVELLDGDGVATVVGDMSWHPAPYGPNEESRALNIGIGLLTAYRGRGIGTVAQRMLAARLFETTSVYRVEASTDVENVAEQRALERAGFTREGVVRGAQYRAGAHHDLVVYSRLRGDG